MTDKNTPIKIPESLQTQMDETSKTPMPVEQPAGEHNGPKGPEPTRYGDWEQKGRCTDF